LLQIKEINSRLKPITDYSNRLHELQLIISLEKIHHCILTTYLELSKKILKIVNLSQNQPTVHRGYVVFSGAGFKVFCRQEIRILFRAKKPLRKYTSRTPKGEAPCLRIFPELIRMHYLSF